MSSLELCSILGSPYLTTVRAERTCNCVRANLVIQKQVEQFQTTKTVSQKNQFWLEVKTLTNHLSLLQHFGILDCINSLLNALIV